MLTVLGVPDIAPVDESNEMPLGSDGLIDHETTVPPLEVGVAVVIAESLAKVRKLGLYATDDGARSLTWMVTVAVPLPPALLAVTVYDVDEETVEGVPLMAPAVVFNDSPAESAGVIDQDATGPPLAVGVTVLIATPFTSVIELGL